MDLSYFLTGPIPKNAMQDTSWNYGLVVLSYVIATLASYVALDLAARLRSEPDKKTKVYWLLGGAFAMGAGIWSMHFIGMLAFVMPLPMGYHFGLTALSLIIAVLASAFALFLVRKDNQPAGSLAIGGVLLGLGIASMHYTGMAAMEHVHITYEPVLWLASIAIAIAASEAALWIALRNNKGTFKRQLTIKIASAFVMGAAIFGMHYTGMAAAVFVPGKEAMSTLLPEIPTYALAFYIAGITAAILAVTLIASTLKQLLMSAIRKEKDFLNTILDNLEDGIVACNLKGKITVLNNAVQKMIDFSRADRTLKSWNEHCQFYKPNSEHPVPHEDLPLQRALKGERVVAKEFILKTKEELERNVIVDGQPIYDPNNRETIGAVIAIHDITLRKEMENQLVRQATHDMLTDLPNRTLLIDRLEQAIHRARRSNTIVAVLFIDIDHFKLINDNFGHAAGDELLLLFSKRLKTAVRESDTVARLSGDEFVVLLTGVDNEEHIISLAHKVLIKLSQPFLLTKVSHALGNANHKTKVTVSIGVSSFPKNGDDPDALLKNADTAMYRVKAQGRNGVKFFSEDMNARTIKRLELEQHLYSALEKEQYILHYQPIIDLTSGYIIGFEALLRWQHPTLGLLLPMDFIPLCEETGLIIPIGEWVLRKACSQNKKWQNRGLPKVRVSVNISGRQINESDLYNTVKTILSECDLDPRYLELELTESGILEFPVKSFRTLSDLKELGVNIALDDFGTGYSSLGYLSRLPVNKLKIDRSFVHDITERSENAAIVMAIINLASSMKLKVTAEGMETQSELAFLRFNRCDEVQGYFFSKPLIAEDATKLLEENPKLGASPFSMPSQVEEIKKRS
jgi:diguanylate cyclase (GGDEF)-like protein/PAS domain S-box-containing protein